MIWKVQLLFMRKGADSLVVFFLLYSCCLNGQGNFADHTTFLTEIKSELVKEWPTNRTINLVFHGHSVPAGYFKTPHVNTLESYPYQVLRILKERYPNAVINIVNTAIGGENAAQGASRFEKEVLTHRPDVLFIDYGLNDLRIGLEAAMKSWQEMIGSALENDIKVILLTPSPNMRLELSDPSNELNQHRKQIMRLANDHHIGLVDSYQLFLAKSQAGGSVENLMSQSNHPNAKGHRLIADEILRYF